MRTRWWVLALVSCVVVSLPLTAAPARAAAAADSLDYFPVLGASWSVDEASDQVVTVEGPATVGYVIWRRNGSCQATGADTTECNGTGTVWVDFKPEPKLERQHNGEVFTFVASTAAGEVARVNVRIRFGGDLVIQGEPYFSMGTLSTTAEFYVAVLDKGTDDPVNPVLTLTGLDASLGVPPDCTATATSVACTMQPVTQGLWSFYITVPVCSALKPVSVVASSGNELRPADNALQVDGVSRLAVGPDSVLSRCAGSGGSGSGSGSGSGGGPVIAPPTASPGPSPSAEPSPGASPTPSQRVAVAPMPTTGSGPPLWLTLLAGLGGMLVVVGPAVGFLWWRRRRSATPAADPAVTPSPTP